MNFFLDTNYCNNRIRTELVPVKVIPLKLFYYQTFFETWPD